MAYSGSYRPGGNPPRGSPPPPAGPPGRGAPGGALSEIFGGLIKKWQTLDLETDDLLMALILYLLYRESGDKELLIVLGAMFLS